MLLQKFGNNFKNNLMEYVDFISLISHLTLEVSDRGFFHKKQISVKKIGISEFFFSEKNGVNICCDLQHNL